MKKRTRLVLITFFVISSGLFSCQWHTIVPLPVEIDLNTEVSFSQDVYPIFTNNNCNGCHPALSDPDLSSATNAYNDLTGGSYIDNDTPANSLILTKITAGDHKGTSYTNEEQTLILTWITQGALNN